MLERLSNIELIRGTASAGLSFTVIDKDAFIIDGCILLKKKNDVSVERCFSDIKIEELPKLISTNIPLTLHFDGKGILHKNIAKESYNLKEILPNANYDDFYIQKHAINKIICTASITRKNDVDRIIQKIINLGYYIYSIDFGPHSFFSLKEYLADLPASIYTRKNCYTIDESGKIIQTDNISGIDDMARIEGEQLYNKEVIPYLMALGFFINISKQEENDLQKPELNWEEFLYKKLFNYLRWGLLSLFFVVLMINYLVFESINSKRTNMQNQIQSTNKIISEIKTLTSDLELKESIITESGLSSQTAYSVYGDEIAVTLPRNIVLTRMNFQPIHGQIRDGEEIQILLNEIHIDGLSKSSVEFNNWLKEIRLKEWIYKIDILNYSHDNENSYGEFSIRIRIN